MPTETKKIDKPIIQSKEFRTVFINAFRMRATENDITLTMAAELDDAKGNAFIQDEIRAIMTPRSIKVLMLLLNNVVANIEKKFGPIGLPPGKVEEIDGSLVEKHADKLKET